MFPIDQRTLDEAVADCQVEDRLRQAGLDSVHLGIWDTSGVLRQKRLGLPAAARAFERGWSFIDTIEWWSPEEQAPGAPVAQHRPARVDTASGRAHPFDARTAVFSAEFSGPPLAELSARYQLQRLIERAANVGICARLSWEFECIVLAQSADEIQANGATNLRPAWPENRCWTPSTLTSEVETFHDLQAVLESGGIPVDHVCSELGPGCLELALGLEDAAASADSAALAKTYAKAFFARRGQTATFMSQLDQQYPGLGGHPSLSLWSTIDGRPVLAEEAGTLSKTASAAIAGITGLLPEMLVLAAATTNAYRRYSPGNWAPRTATWGVGNYSCGLRVVTPPDPGEARLELRIPGADTSPHRCLAMLFGAVLWGLEHDLNPPQPIPNRVDARLIGGPVALPRTLLEAAERFDASSAAREIFGDSFVEHVAATAEAEDATCRRMVSPAERLRYLHYV